MKSNKKILASSVMAVAVFAFLIVAYPAFAKDSVEDLKKQIDALKLEVNELKAAQQPIVTAQEGTAPALLDYRSSSQWDPFAEMQQMQDRMNRLFRQGLGHLNAPSGPALGHMSFYEPDLDIRDMKDRYVITLDLPGMEKDKISIVTKDHSLTISGERNYEREKQDDRQGFYRIERRFGSFSRQIPLPEDADPESVTAKYDKGVLEIKILKKKGTEVKEKPKQIQIA